MARSTKTTKKTTAKRSTKAKSAKKKVAAKTSKSKTRVKTAKRKVKAVKAKAKVKAKTRTKASGRTKAKAAVGRKKAASPKAKKTTASKKTKKKAVAVKKAVKKTVRKTAPKRQSGRTTRVTGARAKSPLFAPAPTATKVEQRPAKLKAKELREFKELLLAKRAELAGDLEQLTDEALKGKGSGGGEHSAMPIHMADVGSDNWEQEFTLVQIDHERTLLREIDAALDRIEDKTYGICLATSQPISLARLRAKPWAKYCIDYARAQEGSAR